MVVFQQNFTNEDRQWVRYSPQVGAASLPWSYLKIMFVNLCTIDTLAKYCLLCIAVLSTWLSLFFSPSTHANSTFSPQPLQLWQPKISREGLTEDHYLKKCVFWRHVYLSDLGSWLAISVPFLPILQMPPPSAVLEHQCSPRWLRNVIQHSFDFCNFGFIYKYNLHSNQLICMLCKLRLHCL